ncbi:hypothetical protein RvY_09162 [Ramazzottius varieornatus]|uniref:Alpha-carbonic anhydrase domain-containing protein n=1 Tax=Ramazzottius varieornatus TaxID=947166 RepID=A0A1D1V8H4_RAMVA|nr:hypothetical protein RvY_09162 [Ramazzottius varieornatus]
MSDSIWKHSWTVAFCWLCFDQAFGSWDEWWTYDGISGPDIWGLYNQDWHLCAKGKYQSPVDIDPEHLLFDPKLPHLQIDQQKVTGNLTNNGHTILFSTLHSKGEPINITFKGSSPYTDQYSYRFYEIQLHWGSSEKKGSEHLLRGQAFPGELQIFAFNNALYSNLSQAEVGTHGLLAISVLLQISDQTSTPELSHLLSKLENVIFKDKWITIEDVSLRNFIPNTTSYISYPGSLTKPGCQETVQWFVMNKPLYITKAQLYALRKIRKGPKEAPGGLMENNFRKVKPVGQHRVLRTNIDLKHARGSDRCPTMYQNKHYEVKTSNIA